MELGLLIFVFAVASDLNFDVMSVFLSSSARPRLQYIMKPSFTYAYISYVSIILLR